MITTIRKEYYWPNMKTKIVEYLEKCMGYQ